MLLKSLLRIGFLNLMVDAAMDPMIRSFLIPDASRLFDGKVEIGMRFSRVVGYYSRKGMVDSDIEAVYYDVMVTDIKDSVLGLGPVIHFDEENYCAYLFSLELYL